MGHGFNLPSAAAGPTTNSTTDHSAHLWNMSRAAFPELYPPQDSNGCNAARLETFTTTLFDTSRVVPSPTPAAAAPLLLSFTPSDPSPSPSRAPATGSPSPGEKAHPFSSDFFAPNIAVKRDDSHKAEVTLKSISDLKVASEGSSFAKLMWPREPALLTSVARE